MSKHDWEALYDQLETATSEWSRPELITLLRDLIREYVIERGLPTGTPEQAAGVDHGVDLATLDFAALIGHLKRTLQLPELDLFQIEGRRVIVDAEGPRELVAQVTAVNPAPTVRRPTPAASPHATPGRPAADPPVAPPAPADSSGNGRPVSRRFRKLEFD